MSLLGIVMRSLRVFSPLHYLMFHCIGRWADSFGLDHQDQANDALSEFMPASMRCSGPFFQVAIGSQLHFSCRGLTSNVAGSYLDIREHPGISHALPIAVGDNFRGYRLVGTLPSSFKTLNIIPGRNTRFHPEDGGWTPTARSRDRIFAAQQLGESQWYLSPLPWSSLR